MSTRNSEPDMRPTVTTNFAADRTALLLVYPCNEPESMQAGHDANGPRFALSLLTTEELLSLMA